MSILIKKCNRTLIKSHTSTYNSSCHINKCIESLIGQTFVDIEILIQDGKSKDETLEIIKQYADPRIKVVSERDKGIYDAINKGISRAKGEWIYIMVQMIDCTTKMYLWRFSIA